MFGDNDTIAAPATAPGGALSIIRLSGTRAVECADAVFRGRRPLAKAAPATLHYGRIVDGQRTVDDVVVALFRAPHSYTGEDSVEISCHGSQYIVSEILRLLTTAGARLAAPGEFTARAFLAGRIDLSQAEAVADMIAADSRAAHAMASTQMRGAYSDSLRELRDKLLRLTSLLELELDFSEEDVAFADRTELHRTMREIASEIGRLTDSFTLGNAIKEGVAVAIVGAPNAGKSTLLNRLLGEERAMVSDIAGTTRDTIEERMNIDGVTFRFIDTAGLRDTDDRLEALGIERTREAISRAGIVISMTTPGRTAEPVALRSDQHLIRVINKIDLAGTSTSSLFQPTAARTADCTADGDSAGRSVSISCRPDECSVTATQPGSSGSAMTESAIASGNRSDRPISSSSDTAEPSAGHGLAADTAATATHYTHRIGTASADSGEASANAVSAADTEELSPEKYSAATDRRPEPVYEAETASCQTAAPASSNTTRRDIDFDSAMTHHLSAANNSHPEPACAVEITACPTAAPTNSDTVQRNIDFDSAMTHHLSAANNSHPEPAYATEPTSCPIAAPTNSDTTRRDTAIRISALTGEGIDDLLSALRATVDTRALYAGDAIVSSARHREALTAAGDSLARALDALDTDLPADLLSEDIRSVIHHLGTITGEITSDDILSNIFSKFCIGK